MSEEGITLSDDLIHGIMNLVVQHDEATAQDMVRGLQYVAAVIGYLAADYPGPKEQRDEMLDYLHEFTKHVANEKAQSAPAAAPAAQEAEVKGKCTQSGDNAAMGVWTPS